MWPKDAMYSNLSRDMLNHDLRSLSPVSIKNIYPLVDGKQMGFLESFSTFFTTIRFVVFSGIIVFFVFVNTMSSEMHRGWQNFLANFAWNFQQISFKKGYFIYAGKKTSYPKWQFYILFWLQIVRIMMKNCPVKWQKNWF